MVLLRILSRSEEKIDRTAEFLLREQLGMDLNIKRNIERLSYTNSKVEKGKVHLLTAKTKGQLFPTIDDKLREMFKEQMPEVYSIPIVHMDWEQSKQLIEDVRGV